MNSSILTCCKSKPLDWWIDRSPNSTMHPSSAGWWYSFGFSSGNQILACISRTGYLFILKVFYHARRRGGYTDRQCPPPRFVKCSYDADNCNLFNTWCPLLESIKWQNRSSPHFRQKLWFLTNNNIKSTLHTWRANPGELPWGALEGNARGFGWRLPLRTVAALKLTQNASRMLLSKIGSRSGGDQLFGVRVLKKLPLFL